MAKAEAAIQKAIIDFMRHDGFMVWRNQTQGVMMGGGKRARSTNTGSPDIMALKNGIFYGIEVKTSTGKVATHQQAWLALASLHGARCFVARSLQCTIDTLKIYESLDNKTPLPEERDDAPLFGD